MRVVITVAAAAVSLAACGGSGGDNAALPGSPDAASSAPAPSATASAATSPSAAVLSSYLGFWDALIAANTASDPALPALAAAAAEPQLGKARKAIRVNKTQGVSLRGTVTHKPKVTASSPASATVEDCYDVSRWTPVDVKTGQKIDVTEANGTGRYRARYTLRRSGGGWRVTDQVALGGC
ncbi:MAG TPA: hypothetical protein VI357_12480 [Mycobacteriales bacterium]